MKLYSTLTEDKLMVFGFRDIGNCKYSFCKNIYKDIIFVKFIVDLSQGDDRGIDYDVIDRNTQQSYYPFFFNINGDNNQVAEYIKRKFDEIISDMENKEIIEKRKRRLYRNV